MRRIALLGCLALIAGAGCHVGPQRSSAKVDPPIARLELSPTRFITQHNQNAAAIRSLTAEPAINLVGEHGTKRWSNRVNGQMALERSKNFRLEIATPGLKRPLADIGSNDEEFWFWMDDDDDRSIYYCENDEVNSSQLGIALQPDWIIEAMGLRGYTDEEVRTIQTRAGEVPGTIVLTQNRRDSKNQKYVKETIVNQDTNRILKHQLYDSNKNLLASATVSQYQVIEISEDNPANSQDGVSENGKSAPKTIVLLPKNFRLKWIKEKLELEIAMTDVLINPRFAKNRQTDLFTEPKIAGVTRQNLAQLDTSVATASSRVYQSLPNSDSGISLERPEPAEGSNRRAIEPAPLTSESLSRASLPPGIVRAPIPAADSSTFPATPPTRRRSFFNRQ